MVNRLSDFIRVRGYAARNIAMLGIFVAAIALLIATGTIALPKLANSWTTGADGPSNVLISALLLNIALIALGFRHYRELTREIEERRSAEANARTLIETDPLTGCLNRRSITNAIGQLIQQTTSQKGAVAVFMVDLDNFKQINDLRGHSIGDEVLKTTAKRMQESAPDGSLIARLGGDEFAIIAPFDNVSPDVVERLATKLIEHIAAPQIINDATIEITMSMGVISNTIGEFSGEFSTALSDGSIAHTIDRTIDAKTLMHRADIAMYYAKKRGKNRFAWFEPAMENEIFARTQIENGIRRGIQQGEFVPYYEQQIDIQTGKLLGFEMLARWNSPDLGLVKPDIFIPIAEEIGLIDVLSEQLIEQALIDAKEWSPEVTLSVNISPVQLRDPWFSQKLLRLLMNQNFPSQRLEIEITESCLHENLTAVKSIITSLKNQGIQISLDDFGTGYSSLTHLRTLPFDRLKIDRSFISEVKDTKGSGQIVNAIILLGQGLDLPITAEGIENTKILKALQGRGQMKGQGYLYGRPEPAAMVKERLAKLEMLATPHPIAPISDSASDPTIDIAEENWAEAAPRNVPEQFRRSA